MSDMAWMEGPAPYTREQVRANGWDLRRGETGAWWLTHPDSDRDIHYGEPGVSEDEVWNIVLRVSYPAWHAAQEAEAHDG